MACLTRCQCDVINDTATGSFTQDCGAPATTIFQSFLSTPPVGTLFLAVANTTCTVTVSVLQTNGNVITRTITPTTTSLVIPLVLTVSRIDRITVACSGGGEGATCSISWALVFHYCKCCRV